jgi:hypothetical protein
MNEGFFQGDKDVRPSTSVTLRYKVWTPSRQPFQQTWHVEHRRGLVVEATLTWQQKRKEPMRG